MSKFKGVKTDNAKINAKKELRQTAINAIDGERKVLEVFCGMGEMYQDVWNKCDQYLGIDKRRSKDDRSVLTGDAMSCLQKVDCSLFNIFDIDAYGSPYDVLEFIVENIADKKFTRLAFCVTDGVQMDLRMGNITRAMAALSGINFKKVNRAHLIHDAIIKRIIDNIANQLSCHVVDSHIAIGNTGSGMRYYSFVVEKN